MSILGLSQFMDILSKLVVHHHVTLHDLSLHACYKFINDLK